MFKSTSKTVDLNLQSADLKSIDAASCVEFNTMPIFHENVALPDGTRSGLLIMADPEHELWRVRLNGEFIYGTVEKNNDDFVFVISETEVNALSDTEDVLFQQLSKCDGIVRKIIDPTFANDFYGALAGNTWSHSNFIHNVNARSSGKIVAKLRGGNECYMDFFGSGTEGEVQSNIGNILHSHQFKLSAIRDPNVDAIRAEEIVINCESRTMEGSPPRWFAMWVGELDTNKGLLNRMLSCCYHGQATLEEFEEFYICSATLDE